MNFLAHVWLAGESEDDRVGGLAGDFVKGVLPGELAPALVEGVRLHRAIDAFAETHPAFVRSRRRVSSERRRVAGIMVDLFYDHFLARDWERWHDEKLETYTAALYARLWARAAELPHGLVQLLPRMASQDWLASYRDFTAVSHALDRMASRLSRPELLLGAGVELHRDPLGFEADFHEFLPAARAFVERWRQEHAGAA